MYFLTMLITRRRLASTISVRAFCPARNGFAQFLEHGQELLRRHAELLFHRLHAHLSVVQDLVALLGLPLLQQPRALVHERPVGL